MSDINNLGQLISHLAQKAGIDQNDKNLIHILSNAELSKITVHPDLTKNIDESLLSLKQALNNHPTIKNQYHAQALNGIDQKMEDIMNDLGLDDATIQELKDIKSTHKRFETLTSKIKDAAKADAEKNKKPDDQSALKKQVDDLLLQLKNKDAEYATALQAIEKERRTDKIAYELKSYLSSKQTIYDELDPEVKTTTLNALIQKALQDKNAEFVFDNKGTFELRTKDGASVVGANHTKYTPQSLIDETLAQNKILKVSTPASPQSDNDPSKVIKVFAGGTEPPKGNNQTANINRKNREAILAAQKQS